MFVQVHPSLLAPPKSVLLHRHHLAVLPLRISTRPNYSSARTMFSALRLKFNESCAPLRTNAHFRGAKAPCEGAMRRHGYKRTFCPVLSSILIRLPSLHLLRAFFLTASAPLLRSVQRCAIFQDSNFSTESTPTVWQVGVTRPPLSAEDVNPITLITELIPRRRILKNVHRFSTGHRADIGTHVHCPDRDRETEDSNSRGTQSYCQEHFMYYTKRTQVSAIDKD